MQTRSSPNIETLQRLAKQATIPDYKKLSKQELFQRLKEQFDIDRLMRTEARHERLKNVRESKKRKHEGEEQNSPAQQSPAKSTSSAPPVKKVKLNTIDPIMMVPIGKKSCFKFVRPNGTVVRFNIESLVDYLIASGDFNDPETRIPFSDADLTEIDAIAKKSGLNKASVLAAKNDVNAYSEAKFRRDALLALERCAGEVVTDILQIVETYDPDEAQMQLVMREFPAFLDYFRQIKDADPAYASKCNAHWRLFMKGPPNRPNRDECGLIHVVCHFLKNCDQGQY
eukprot:CAMPEP_0184986566 /NCGR_PEP_ID=MMETSP1098-20130426/17259_1 /TAXON_ID=89044 /ORGANISM="Spumella elongata, Strain CCAP 955/1" /LENGTH=283 /DNA_ID=CAMNT_0027510877 /DNA_START=158 /DNA_END=1009 /DNA_ORIENTATION=-